MKFPFEWSLINSTDRRQTPSPIGAILQSSVKLLCKQIYGVIEPRYYSCLDGFPQKDTLSVKFNLFVANQGIDTWQFESIQ